MKRTWPMFSHVEHTQQRALVRATATMCGIARVLLLRELLATELLTALPGMHARHGATASSVVQSSKVVLVFAKCKTFAKLDRHSFTLSLRKYHTSALLSIVRSI